MRYIITEEQFKKIKKSVEKFVESMDIPGICGFWFDEETENDGTPWVYFILDSDMLTGKDQILFISSLKKTIKSEIENVFGFKVMIGILVKKCSELND